MENEFGALKMQFRGKDGFENTWLYGDLVHRKDPLTNREKFPHIERCDLAKCQILGNIFDNLDLLNDINE